MNCRFTHRLPLHQVFFAEKFAPWTPMLADTVASTREPRKQLNRSTILHSSKPAASAISTSSFSSKAPPTQPAQPAKPKKQQTQRARGEVGARIQRATDKARGVEENVAQRVQKFREISSVVIDEAGYDPSLRFVLVAAILFVLFVLIVILNKFIA